MDTDTLDLVESTTPLTALEELLANAVKPGVEIDELMVVGMTALEGTLTRIDVALNLQPNDLSSWVYGGTTSIEYNRIDLADFFSGIALKFKPPSFPTTTAWLCSKIASVGKIKFDPNDFIQESITEEMAVNYFLKANPTSLRFIGQVSVSLFTQTPLMYYFVNPQGVFTTEVGSLTSITSEWGIGMISNFTNGTILGPMLVGLKAGYIFSVAYGSAKQSWDLFNRVLNMPVASWVIDASGPGPYNGYGATVTYNGPIDPNLDKPYNPALTQVCRIKLSKTYCTNQAGTLSIYYSTARVGN